MWQIERDEDGNEHKIKYMTINEIDELDVFFYLDLEIYNNNKGNIKAIARMDAMGL
ncbi:MAG TPA: hypothetical protein VIK26_06100 [Clostridium sp.]